jgi:sporulation protein YlmC with PRC-barrel domain
VIRHRDLGLHLLDRQVQDPEGNAVCKVDDLELTVPEDGGPPVVTAILSGPQALAPRIGGLTGRWLLFWSHALSRTGTDQPDRIPFELVSGIGSAITITRTRRGLGIQGNEDRVRTYLVERLPGARHASK